MTKVMVILAANIIATIEQMTEGKVTIEEETTNRTTRIITIMQISVIRILTEKMNLRMRISH